MAEDLLAHSLTLETMDIVFLCRMKDPSHQIHPHVKNQPSGSTEPKLAKVLSYSPWVMYELLVKSTGSERGAGKSQVQDHQGRWGREGVREERNCQNAVI